eukprot:g9745.t1
MERTDGLCVPMATDYTTPLAVTAALTAVLVGGFGYMILFQKDESEDERRTRMGRFKEGRAISKPTGNQSAVADDEA